MGTCGCMTRADFIAFPLVRQQRDKGQIQSLPISEFTMIHSLSERFVRSSLQRAKNLAKFAGVSGAALALMAQNAHAAIDITAATAGITDASTAVLAVIAAMITMAVAVWGVKKVLKFFRG